MNPNRLSSEVVFQVAATVDEPPERLDPPLHDVIDPDALDRLFWGRDPESDRASGRIAFTYAGCHVVANSSGEVEVTPLTGSPATTPG